MRYVSLIKRENASSHDTVIINGCGPNFVYNRRESFSSMIKEQGVIFWFRFWLTFCFNPGCPYLKKFYRKWPALKNYLNIHIHREFLEGSVEDAIRYCLAKAIMYLRTPVLNPITKKKSARAMLCELQDFVEMAFGAALCEVFCIWLKASEMSDKTVSYWQLPNHYLYLHFEPGRLEKFLVKQWDDFLLLLFDVNLKDIPWFLKVLYSPTCDISLTADNEITRLCDDSSFQNMMEYMRIIRDQCRIKIQVIDELPIIDVNYNVRNLNNGLVEQKFMRPMLKQFMANESLRTSTQQVCAHCSNTIDVGTISKFRLCKRCVEENCIEPNYYCNATCQIEHWFLHHHDEHAAMLNSSAYHCPSVYGKDSVNSFPFCPGTNSDLCDDPLLGYRLDNKTEDDDEMHYYMLNKMFEESPEFRENSELADGPRTKIAHYTAPPISCLNRKLEQIKSSRKLRRTDEIVRLNSDSDESFRSTSNPELTVLLKLRLESDENLRSELIHIPKMFKFPSRKSKQETNFHKREKKIPSSDVKVPFDNYNSSCLILQIPVPTIDPIVKQKNQNQIVNLKSSSMPIQNSDSNKPQEQAAYSESTNLELPSLNLSELEMKSSKSDSILDQTNSSNVDETEMETKTSPLDVTAAKIKTLNLELIESQVTTPNSDPNAQKKNSQMLVANSGLGKRLKRPDPGKPPLPKSLSNSGASKIPHLNTCKSLKHNQNMQRKKLSKPKSVTNAMSF